MKLLYVSEKDRLGKYTMNDGTWPCLYSYHAQTVSASNFSHHPIMLDAIELEFNLHQYINECMNCCASVVYMTFLYELYRDNIFLTLQALRNTGNTDGVNSSLHRWVSRIIM